MIPNMDRAVTEDALLGGRVRLLQPERGYRIAIDAVLLAAVRAADPDAIRYHRAFYIIDRSIPVAHEPGRDHNVWDAVLLRRIVE